MKEKKKIITSLVLEKYILSALMILLIFLCNTSINVEAKIQKNPADVKALRKIIKIQRDKGADIINDLNDYSYVWSETTGRLKKIYWNNCNIKGKLFLKGLSELKSFNCNNNQITQLKFEKNNKLKKIYCKRNKIKKLNISKMKGLKYIECDRNPIKRLNVSKLKNLQVLYCNHNKLKELDVSNLKKLKQLFCAYNSIEKLELKSEDLIDLNCQNNNLKSLIVKKTRKLQQCICSHNELTSLKLQGIQEPGYVNCSYNELQKLKIVDSNLNYLYCYNNQLRNLDVSRLIKLKGLDCTNNQLVKLDLRGLNMLKYLYYDSNVECIK